MGTAVTTKTGIDPQDHLKIFFWLARRICKPSDPFEAADLVHDSWTSLVKMCRQFRPGGMSEKQFLFHFGGRILRTKRWRRKFRTWQPIPVDDEGNLLVEPVDDGLGPVQSLINEEDGQQLHRFLKILPPLDQQAIEIYFGLGGQRKQSLEDVGRTLGVSKQRAQQRVRRGILRLRQVFQEV